ncbi:MAG: polysaccharide biosynthesis tyrosine autokinase, partial [Rhodobacteraceae bacterium]|nr:polysaccharide biosynthesis tyrosine autokinase [Paracoccaceae bacterium]
QQTATNARNQYQTLLARAQDLGTLANLQIADARVVSEALPQTTPVAPNVRLILVLAMIGGTGLGVMLAFMNEYYIGGVVSASQLENILQSRVPITVPQLAPSDAGPSVADLIITAPMSAYAEAFRKLRATIDVMWDRAKTDTAAAEADARPQGRPASRVILVCSALQAEGKTTSAISLARTYAVSGIRTLLIDGDLRKPAIAARMGLDSNIGLLDYLLASGHENLSEVVAVNDPISSLVVLVAGERSSAPTDQLINSASFRSLLKVARENFDVIILDSPPLLPVVDARYLARYADAVLQVVRYGTTTQGEVREALAQLQEIMPERTAYFGILSHEERGNRTGGYYGRYSYYGDGDA